MNFTVSNNLAALMRLGDARAADTVTMSFGGRRRPDRAPSRRTRRSSYPSSCRQSRIIALYSNASGDLIAVETHTAGAILGIVPLGTYHALIAESLR